ncbi:MAG TPA: hypothetical protein VFC21_06705 [Bryobacteraceae bacterium]|nr:hypothetical protein [Bryobacteraceae bacterium]
MDSDDRMITRQQLDESLERMMNNMLFEFKLMRDEVNVRFDRVDKRFERIESLLDRQAGLIQLFERSCPAPRIIEY